MSIVVLPFVNLRGDSQQDYFADGITDSLTTDLSHALPGSFVVSRDTAFTYKGRVADMRRIGRELDVRYALAGSVMPDGERVRVNAELVDAQAGVALWAERFDVERAGVLQVQDEIVGRLARAIGLNVVDAEARRSERERPHSADAADLVMRARAIANRPSSAANMIGARQLYEQALTMEADNIDALAGVATTLVFEALNGYYTDGNAERLMQAGTLLRRTLALEPRHFASLKAKSAMLRAQGRFNDAIVAAQAVIAENPAEPWAYKEIGLSRMYLGRPEEALAVVRQGRPLRPARSGPVDVAGRPRTGAHPARPRRRGTALAGPGAGRESEQRQHARPARGGLRAQRPDRRRAHVRSPPTTVCVPANGWRISASSPPCRCT